VSVVLLTVVAVGTAGCSQQADQQQHTPPAPTATQPAITTSLPAFSDWRPAYLGPSGHLYVTTLNGQDRLSGPALPDLTFNGLVVGFAGVSPDGHLVAYSGANGLHVVDVTGRLNTSHIPAIAAQELAWSPDSARLALGDGQGNIGVVDLQSGTYTNAPPSPAPGLADLLGWTDNTHLVVTTVPAVASDPHQLPTTVGVGALAISTWALRPIAMIHLAGLGTPHFALSPDGTHVLFYNKLYRGAAYTPLVADITVASGRVTPRPHLTAAMGDYSGFTSLAWRADGHTLAASTGFANNGDLTTWVLDLQQDTAVSLPLAQAQYVAAWAPSTDALILTTGWQSLVNGGPYELSALTVDPAAPAAPAAPILLARDVVTFPFVGFVRSQ
jgi:WD40 repeat protein